LFGLVADCASQSPHAAYAHHRPEPMMTSRKRLPESRSRGASPPDKRPCSLDRSASTSRHDSVSDPAMPGWSRPSLTLLSTALRAVPRQILLLPAQEEARRRPHRPCASQQAQEQTSTDLPRRLTMHQPCHPKAWVVARRHLSTRQRPWSRRCCRRRKSLQARARILDAQALAAVRSP